MAITRISQSTVKEGLEKYNSFYAGLSGLLFGNYESIQTITVGSGGASSIEFTSIPGTYQHLQIRAVLLTSGETNPGMRFGNGSLDTGSNYRGHHLWGTGSTANANSNSLTYFYCNYNPSSSYPSAQVTDILDYASTTKNKVMRTFAGFDANGGTSEVALWSGLWLNTAAVTHLSLITTNAGITFSQYSTAALYGVRAP